MRELRASELGSCLTRQVHKQLGSTALDPPATLQAAFDRGNVHEEACVAEMRAQGWKVYGEQDVIALFPNGVRMDTTGQLALSAGESAATIWPDLPWVLTGHLDGRCYTPSDYVAACPRVLEVKAPGAWAKFERAYGTNCWDDPLAHMYSWQLAAYQVATGLEAVVACLDEGQLKWFVVETPIHSEAEIIARCEEIVRLADLGTPSSDCEPGLRDDWSCPYRHLHSAPERPETEDGELDRLVGLYGAEKALRDAAEARMKQYRDEIDAHLGLDDTRETASSIATRVTTTRTTLDKAAVRAAGIDLVPFEKQSVSTSIRVTIKGAPDNG